MRRQRERRWRKRNRSKKKRGLLDALKFVANSPELSCLAVMAISQGISTILFQVAWKTQLRILHPNPTAYAQFMGNVQMYSGFVTGIFMISAPFLFRNIGWKGTLSITPKCVIVLGWFFLNLDLCVQTWSVDANEYLASSFSRRWRGNLHRRTRGEVFSIQTGGRDGVYCFRR